VSGGTQVRVATGRTWAISGYVNTSHGRVSARVSQTFDYLNTDLVTAAGAGQDVHQSDRGETQISVNGHTTRQGWSYPIAVHAQVLSLVDDNNYDLQASVDQGRQLSQQALGGRGWRTVTASDDRVTARGVLARTNGVVSQADGRDAEDYQAIGPDGCYHHVITADHGYVTSDQRLGSG
jgi:hypothetical protein